MRALVARWRTRPAKPEGPATWQEVFNRAEQKRDDDDLYWIPAAEDLGFLTVGRARNDLRRDRVGGWYRQRHRC